MTTSSAASPTNHRRRTARRAIRGAKRGQQYDRCPAHERDAVERGQGRDVRRAEPRHAQGEQRADHHTRHGQSHRLTDNQGHDYRSGRSERDAYADLLPARSATM